MSENPNGLGSPGAWWQARDKTLPDLDSSAGAKITETPFSRQDGLLGKTHSPGTLALGAEPQQ